MLLELLAPKLGLIFIHTIIFVCVAFILKRYAWGPLLAIIKQEEDNGVKAQADVKIAKLKVKQLQISSRQLITKANERSQHIINTALATKQALIEEASEEIIKEKALMIKKASQVIARKEAAARHKIKQEAALLVVAATQKLLVKELEKQDTQAVLLHALIEETIKEQHATNM